MHSTAADSLAKLDPATIAADFPHYFRLSQGCRSYVDPEPILDLHIQRLCRESYWAYRLRCSSLPYARRHRYTYQSLSRSQTRLLQLTLRWPLHASLPGRWLRCLYRILRSAARLFGCIPNINFLSSYNYEFSNVRSEEFSARFEKSKYTAAILHVTSREEVAKNADDQC